MGIIENIRELALKLLDENEQGLRYSELIEAAKAAFPDSAPGTRKLPNRVYKASRGLFRSVKFKGHDVPIPPDDNETDETGKIKESDFYESFADWLENELEECSKAVALGGHKFGSKWGTPDVIGVNKPKENDILKFPLEITAAEIKLETKELITAFGQACAYKLFCHRSYLVIPMDSTPEDKDRLDSLCRIFGIGLILYNSKDVENPAYAIRNRTSKHDPDTYYANEALKLCRMPVEMDVCSRGGQLNLRVEGYRLRGRLG